MMTVTHTHTHTQLLTMVSEPGGVPWLRSVRAVMFTHTNHVDVQWLSSAGVHI